MGGEQVEDLVSHSTCEFPCEEFESNSERCNEMHEECLVYRRRVQIARLGKRFRDYQYDIGHDIWRKLEHLEYGR